MTPQEHEKLHAVLVRVALALLVVTFVFGCLAVVEVVSACL